MHHLRAQQFYLGDPFTCSKLCLPVFPDEETAQVKKRTPIGNIAAVVEVLKVVEQQQRFMKGLPWHWTVLELQSLGASLGCPDLTIECGGAPCVERLKA